MAFDLFDALARISSGDQQWFDRLSDEDKKAASPFVIARWLTGTSDQAQLIRLNTFVNPYVFSLGQDKALLFKLMAAACTGKTKRYQWIKGPPATKATKRSTEVVMQYYDMTSREAGLVVGNVSGADLLEMAEELGWDKEELTKLKKEVDEPGSAEKSGSGKKKPK